MMKLPTTSSVISDIRKKWPPRNASSHKGNFGKLALLAGSEGMTGAASLCASAALVSGAGLISLGVPRKIYPILAKTVEREIMVKPFPSTVLGTFSSRGLKQIRSFLKDKDVIALGPGITQSAGAKKLLRSLITEISSHLVIDADGLNALAGNPGILKKAHNSKILTPHMGEYLRLVGGEEPKSLRQKIESAQKTAKEYRVTLVLKGKNTVVANAEGQLFINPTGNPGMASGGMGDVLTGMIAAFLGQHKNVFEATSWAVFLHGYAADEAVKKTGQLSLRATDVIKILPMILKKVLRK